MFCVKRFLKRFAGHRSLDRLCRTRPVSSPPVTLSESVLDVFIKYGIFMYGLDCVFRGPADNPLSRIVLVCS